jgi:hypothetical protein
MSAPLSNVWLGCSAINFSNVQEAGALQVTSVDDYLNSIEYVVDVFAKKEDLAAMLEDVGIAYARDGTADFASLLADGTTTSANAYTIQLNAGYSFDLDNGTEMIGRMPCKLRKNFASQVNAGADDIVLADGSFPLVASSNAGVSDIQTLTIDPSAGTSGDVIVSMSDVGAGSTYGTTNIAMAAIPKAISAQMEGFASDENLLRLVANAASYFNLMTFPVGGSVDQSDNVVSLHNILKGKSGITQFETHEVAALLRDMGDETATVQTRKIGHHILASILNANPPSSENTATIGTAGDSDLWKVVDSDTATGYDVIKLDSTAALDNVLLQYVLKTKMTLKSRSGAALNSTVKSPNSDDAETHEVHILYNIRFDR